MDTDARREQAMGKHMGSQAAASREPPGPAEAGKLPERTACALLV